MPSEAPYREVVASARAAGDTRAVLHAVPYARFMGISVEAIAGERLTRMAYQPALIGNPSLPAIHGGAIGALLECAAIFELLWNVEVGSLPRIVNISVDYLRSGRPEDVWAKAELTRQGRRVANVSALAWQEDRTRPIAAAQAHFLIDPVGDER